MFITSFGEQNITYKCCSNFLIHLSKIHLAVDSNGNPIAFIISDGTTHDVKIAPDLVTLLDLEQTEILCADKGYDSEPLRSQIKVTKTKANIPKKSNTKKKQ